MDWDDVRPEPRNRVVIGEKLDRFSVDELEQRIKQLEEEIGRVRFELDAKRDHAARAKSVFKS